MNQLEKAFFSIFATDYQQLVMKIERHEKVLDELADEENRLHAELESLYAQRERLLVDFAANMLRVGDK